MPRRLLMLLLCAALALPAPFAWGQAAPPAADFQSALSGTGHPLTLKVSDLDTSWRRVFIGKPLDTSIFLLGQSRDAFSAASNPYYTRGQTETVGGETFLVAYRYVPPVPADASGEPPPPPVQTPDTTLTLSLINVRQISSLDGVQVVTAQTQAEAQQAQNAAYDAQSQSNLKQIGLGLIQYTQDSDENLPPMQSAAVAKTAIFPYIKSEAVFRQPQTHEPYQPNTSLSGRSLASFNSPSTMVIYYEASPAPDGTRGVLFFDGHAKRFPEAEWPALKAASHVPNPP